MACGPSLSRSRRRRSASTARSAARARRPASSFMGGQQTKARTFERCRKSVFQCLSRAPTPGGHDKRSSSPPMRPMCSYATANYRVPIHASRDAPNFVTMEVSAEAPIPTMARAPIRRCRHIWRFWRKSVASVPAARATGAPESGLSLTKGAPS